MENKKIDNVNIFNSAYDAIESFTPDAISSLTAEQERFLQHFDDFEYYTYIILDYERILIADGSDVICDCSFSEFLRDTIDAAIKQTENDED